MVKGGKGGKEEEGGWEGRGREREGNVGSSELCVIEIPILGYLGVWGGFGGI